MRKWLVLSITRQPAAAARGACTAEIAAPGLNRPISQPLKSKVSRLLDLEHLLVAEADLLPDGAGGGEGDDLGHREAALVQGLEDLATDRTGGTDDCDPVTHVPLRLSLKLSPRR